MKTKSLKISQLRADYGANVRFADNYGDISDLANNIQMKGLLVPLTVESLPDGSFGIISGHRRFAALQMLIEQGHITDADQVFCTVQSYESEVERAAGKLLANDGQPLSPDEFSAEIARLADLIKDTDPNFIQTIASGLGKRPEYVKQMYDTWSKLGSGAKKAIQEGKVGMTLAVLLAKKAGSDKLASLSVEIAAAAKEQVKQSGKTVSDSVVADAVVLTTNKVLADVKAGANVTGEGIGADLLANIAKVQGAKKAAVQVKRDIETGKQTFESYVNNLIASLPDCSAKEILMDTLQAFQSEMPINNIQSILKKAA